MLAKNLTAMEITFADVGGVYIRNVVTSDFESMAARALAQIFTPSQLKNAQNVHYEDADTSESSAWMGIVDYRRVSVTLAEVTPYVIPAWLVAKLRANPATVAVRSSP